MSKKSKTSSKLPSKRQLRVGEQIRHALASMFIKQDVCADELRDVSITVSEVSVSPDLSNAKVFVMTLGGQDVEIILPILNRTAPLFAHHVSQKVHLRRVPKLKFLIDGSFDHVEKITSLFNNLPPSGNINKPSRYEKRVEIISQSDGLLHSRKLLE